MKKYLVLLVSVIGYLAIMLVLSMGVNKIWQNGNIIPEDFAKSNYDFSTMIAFLLTILVIGIIFRLRGRKLIKTCNFSKLSTKNFSIILSIGVLMGIFTSCICNTTYVINNIPIFGYYLYYVVNGTSNFVMFLIVITIMFASEEIIFRGIIFNEFRNSIPLKSAIILSTAVYGILNILTIQVAVGAYALVAAFFYTLAYVFMKSILAPIILQVASIYVIGTVIKTGLWDKVRALGDGPLIAVVIVTIVLMMSLFYVMYLNYKNDRVVGEAAVNL